MNKKVLTLTSCNSDLFAKKPLINKLYFSTDFLLEKMLVLPFSVMAFGVGAFGRRLGFDEAMRVEAS